MEKKTQTIKAFKGFDKDLKCRGYQYEIGKSYDHDGDAILCESGFHACEYPLEVFDYYHPSNSRYCEVELDATDETEDDSKRVGKHIYIGDEIGISGIARAHFEYVKRNVNHSIENGKSESSTAGDSGAATAGDYGAATAGNSGVATAGNSGVATAGDYGAATAGDRGAATAGNRGAATAGDYGVATSKGVSSTGENGISVVRGYNVKAKGGIGAILVIANENDSDDHEIKEWKAVVVDGEKVKPNTWYTIKGGNIVEAESEDADE